ncbi:MAG TPA: winged helix-turn-helix domain-containing protein [Candidatus Limnocylindria bacterium]|jgi:DNA-binding transcriptional ArsR family regulator|nr:winged helix-turn-helix domain-containing protein [Candidatus Limnocylindria bacterium]
MQPPPRTVRTPATRAEARALAHPLRLRILRLCLDEALSNRELAERLGEDPGTVLYHVRTLTRTGFLAAEGERRGRRGAREIPYRATGKSWTLDLGADAAGNLAMIDAARAELAEAGPDAVLTLSRLGRRLRPEMLETLERRIVELVEEMNAADDPAGEPVSLLVALHRRR